MTEYQTVGQLAVDGIEALEDGDLGRVRELFIEIGDRATPDRVIKEVRYLSVGEIRREGWPIEAGNGPPVALVLENDSLIYPSTDPEGNGPGDLFGYDPDEEQGFRLRPKEDGGE